MATQTVTKPEAAIQTVEQWLESHDLEFDSIDVALEDIDIARSLQNQARVSASILPETVDLYAQAMQNGDVFPPIVVYRPARKRQSPYVVIDGNQRVAAALKNELDSLAACEVLKPSPAQVAVLEVEANARHGVATSREERMQQALYLVQVGVTRAQAARLLGLTEQGVQTADRVARTRNRLIGLGMRQSFTFNQVAKMASLRSDNVLLAFAKLVQDAKLLEAEYAPIIVEANEKHTEAAQLAVIQEARTQYNTRIKSMAKGIVGFKGDIRRLVYGMGTLTRIDLDTFDGDMLDSEYRKELVARCEETQAVLRSVRNILT